MKYSRHILFLLFTVLIATGCNVNNSNSSRVNQLYNTFHGTWTPVMSQSNKPIDANLDGQASIDMLDEITNHDITRMTVQILKDNFGEKKYPHLLSLPYPIQVFPPESEPGEPGFYVNYLINPYPVNFKISSTENKLLLESKITYTYRGKTYTFPVAIKLDNDNLIIEVVIQKRLYTSEGWQEVEITTRYARIYNDT